MWRQIFQGRHGRRLALRCLSRAFAKTAPPHAARATPQCRRRVSAAPVACRPAGQTTPTKSANVTTCSLIDRF